MTNTFDSSREHVAVLAAAAGLQVNGHFTDLVVQCENKSFKVHKVIVSASSEWFKTALTSGFKEGVGNAIALMHDDEEDVGRMIYFCYHLNYSDSGGDTMALQARMFALGEKYLMPSMQAYAVSKFRDQIPETFNIADFTAAVQECYGNALDPNRIFKTAIIEKSVEHASRLFNSSASNADFRQMTDRLPEYASDVLFETHKDKSKKFASQSTQKYRCLAESLMLGNACTGTLVLDVDAQCDTCFRSWSQYPEGDYSQLWKRRKV